MKSVEGGGVTRRVENKYTKKIRIQREIIPRATTPQTNAYSKYAHSLLLRFQKDIRRTNPCIQTFRRLNLTTK